MCCVLSSQSIKMSRQTWRPSIYSLFAYVVFVVASKFISDRWLVLYALILCFIGFVLAIDWQLLEWFPESLSDKLYPYLNRFVAGYMVMNAGFMTGRPVTFALYSKLIGQKWQGQYLGKPLLFQSLLLEIKKWFSRFFSRSRFSFGLRLDGCWRISS